ncbi:MAG: hypothetical protein ABR542_10335, partial [Desulfonatronovibrio sp.]
MSAGQELSALPVVPFSFSMEIAAEAASALVGSSFQVTAMHNVRGHRWLTLNDGHLSLKVMAQITDNTNPKHKAIQVTLYLFSPADNSCEEPVFEARVHVADRFPEPRPLPRSIIQEKQGFSSSTAETGTSP